MGDGGTSIDWTTIAVAFFTGVAGVVAASLGGFKRLVDTWFDLADRRLRRRFATGIKQIALIYKAIEDAKRLPYVHRILLLTGKNGGGVPRPGKVFTVSAFFGWSQKAGVDPATFYNFDIQADSHYMTMLNECVRDGFSQQTTAQMPEASMLKSFYAAEGVVDSRLYLMGIDADTNEMHYCSFASYERPFQQGEIHHLNNLAQRLRAVLSHRGHA